MRRTRVLQKVQCCENGAAAVEFAIVAWAFILFMLGIMEIGRMLDARNQLARGADAGVRASSIVPKGANYQNEALTAARAALTTADPDSLDVALGEENVTENGSTVMYRKLTFTYQFRPMLNGIISDKALLTLTVDRLVCPIDKCPVYTP